MPRDGESRVRIPEDTSDTGVVSSNLSIHFSHWINLLGHDDHVEWVKTGNLANSTALARLPMPCKGGDHAGLDAYLPPTALNNLTGITPGTLKTWEVGERHLLNHFLQSVSRALVVVDDDENPFLKVFTPLALENETVKHALVALSACHLSQVYPEWGQDTLNQRSSALRCLKDDIEDLEHVLWSLATTLLLCLLEICEAQSQVWLLHLHGAYALLEQSLDHHESDPYLSTLIDLYDYICCAASLTCDKVPPTFLLRSRADFVDGGSSIHPQYGLSATLYKCLHHCNQVSCRLRREGCFISQEEIEDEIKDIELALQSWSPLEDLSPSRQMREARAAAFATQWAIIMRLRQVMQPTVSDNPQMGKATDNILSALSLIRHGSEMEAHMLFPLFMAGVGSHTKVNRMSVEFRIQVLETTLGFRNIVLAHRLLDEIWRRSNEGIDTNWEHLMREKYPNLVLF
ncbi:unnamed protein product [Clonostachys rosea]|uniref:Fungal-specific transcription factor domain-containing protein n=1 Tax=Bionectria ochroleuca TaxID=29856 RepID=A0ABY6TQ83_BIOOC|nr:unnamed protein product [Clonostachys rosea]